MVTVLTNWALTTDAVDLTAAARELEQPQEQCAISDQEFDQKSKALACSRAMIRVGSRKG